MGVCEVLTTESLEEVHNISQLGGIRSAKIQENSSITQHILVARAVPQVDYAPLEMG